MSWMSIRFQNLHNQQSWLSTYQPSLPLSRLFVSTFRFINNTLLPFSLSLSRWVRLSGLQVLPRFAFRPWRRSNPQWQGSWKVMELFWTYIYVHSHFCFCFYVHQIGSHYLSMTVECFSPNTTYMHIFFTSECGLCIDWFLVSFEQRVMSPLGLL